jgi:hypothetical protein
MERKQETLTETTVEVVCLNDSETKLKEWRFVLRGVEVHFTRYQRSTREHEQAPWQISHLWKALDLTEAGNIEKPTVPAWAIEEALLQFSNKLVFKNDE